MTNTDERTLCVLRENTPSTDLTRSYADPGIAPKQRRLADQQLRAMARGQAPQHFQVVGRILSRLRREHRSISPMLLDAGCGSAYYWEVAEHVVPRWVKYVGVDFNAGMLELARQYYPNLPLARMDLCSLALRDRLFDIVLSGAVIVHIKAWKVAVQELARTARRWLVLHRTLVYTHSPTSVKVERHYDTEVYRVRINEGELLTFLASRGLELVTKYDCGEGRFPEGQENNTYLFERRDSRLVR